MGQSGVIIPSVADRTAATVGTTITNKTGGSELLVFVDITVDDESAAVTFLVDGLDPASGKWYNILTSAALAAVASTVLRVSTHLTASANLIAKDIVPNEFRVRTTVADTDEMTYSVGYSLT
jgi:hypothetical protein